MINVLLPVLFLALPQATPPVAPAPVETARPLSFHSQRFPFRWDVLLPVQAEVEVTNTAKKSRVPGFAVAVFDAEDRLLGVASGGTKLGTVKPGETETFDLPFHQVLQRLPKGDHFFLSIELTD